MLGRLPARPEDATHAQVESAEQMEEAAAARGGGGGGLPLGLGLEAAEPVDLAVDAVGEVAVLHLNAPRRPRRLKQLQRVTPRALPVHEAGGQEHAGVRRRRVRDGAVGVDRHGGVGDGGGEDERALGDEQVHPLPVPLVLARHLLELDVAARGELRVGRLLVEEHDFGAGAAGGAVDDAVGGEGPGAVVPHARGVVVLHLVVARLEAADPVGREADAVAAALVAELVLELVAGVLLRRAAGEIVEHEPPPAHAFHAGAEFGWPALKGGLVVACRARRWWGADALPGLRPLAGVAPSGARARRPPALGCVRLR
mmetsp:Transcript_30657/g.96725  ORF Transcript_30657/g.96725 Transcript_30657/m.96725 type:complete len:313 (+) Transcript_30657:479-1417(+)